MPERERPMSSAIPFGIALVVYGLTAILYMSYLLFKGRPLLGRVATIGVIIGVGVHTLGLLVRTINAGHAPFTNLYESMVFFSWVIAVLYVFIEKRYGLRIIGAFVTLVAFLIIGSASLLPSRYKEISPLVPALQSHWLELHVVTCFLGYGAFAVGFVVGITYLVKEWSSNRQKEVNSGSARSTLSLLDDLGYKTVAIGFLFLTMGIITGAIWANYAWGSYWSWDPKETWALITWLIYATNLHLRRALGWRGKRTAWVSIIGFGAVLFTYFGVSFLLPGLHSYM
jgi:cytochrome c-type biogenesis protein CcsB